MDSHEHRLLISLSSHLLSLQEKVDELELRLDNISKQTTLTARN